MKILARCILIAVAVSLCSIGCANKENGKLGEIGEDAREAAHKTGKVFEGAAKGAIEAIEEK